MDIDGLRHYDHDPLDDEDMRDRVDSQRWYGPIYTIIDDVARVGEELLGADEDEE